MTKYLVVGVGGAAGAIARYWIATVIGERLPTRFPLGTLVVNITGFFVIGFVLTLVTERLNIHLHWRLGIAVGFVGAYTTFSTFEYETFRLLVTGSGISGFMNVIVSLMSGFLAVWGGIAFARRTNAQAVVSQGIHAFARIGSSLTHRWPTRLYSVGAESRCASHSTTRKPRLGERAWRALTERRSRSLQLRRSGFSIAPCMRRSWKN